MSFYVGQRVVCVEKNWLYRGAPFVGKAPIHGAIYHIRGFAPLLADGDPSRQYLWLEEIHNPVRPAGTEPSFAADCFRPVIERKTDITVFTEILDRASGTRSREKV